MVFLVGMSHTECESDLHARGTKTKTLYTDCIPWSPMFPALLLKVTSYAIHV